MKIAFCNCGVTAVHARAVSEDGTYSRPFFSQEGFLRDVVANIFARAFQDSTTFVFMPDDSKEKHKMFLELIDQVPPGFRQLFEDMKKFIENVPELPATDQEAWDALPETVKKPVRTFLSKGAMAVDPKDWPGSFGTDWELVSILGKNPPNNPEAKCNIISRLYSPFDCRSKLER